MRTKATAAQRVSPRRAGVTGHLRVCFVGLRRYPCLAHFCVRLRVALPLLGEQSRSARVFQHKRQVFDGVGSGDAVRLVMRLLMQPWLRLGCNLCHEQGKDTHWQHAAYM